MLVVAVASVETTGMAQGIFFPSLQVPLSEGCHGGKILTEATVRGMVKKQVGNLSLQWVQCQYLVTF